MSLPWRRRIVLPCEVVGQPAPTRRWTKDGKHFQIQDSSFSSSYSSSKRHDSSSFSSSNRGSSSFFSSNRGSSASASTSSGASNGAATLLETGALLLTFSKSSTGGRYTCVASNKHGRAQVSYDLELLGECRVWRWIVVRVFQERVVVNYVGRV